MCSARIRYWPAGSSLGRVKVKLPMELLRELAARVATLEGVAQALLLEDDHRMADAWVESGAHI